MTNIYAYPHWDWVLQELELRPLKLSLSDKLKRAKDHAGGGESEPHKFFKTYIAENPPALGLPPSVGKVQLEYVLPSADAIDVLFTLKGEKIGVEVKSFISDAADILRGIFQCVKYRHLIEAEQIVNDEVPNCRVILALEAKLPDDLVIVKNLLGRGGSG